MEIESAELPTEIGKPGLDGQTPREAAKSPSGREKVDALIRSAIHNSERSPDLKVQKKGIERARTELGF